MESNITLEEMTTLKLHWQQRANAAEQRVAELEEGNLTPASGQTSNDSPATSGSSITRQLQEVREENDALRFELWDMKDQIRSLMFKLTQELSQIGRLDNTATEPTTEGSPPHPATHSSSTASYRHEDKQVEPSQADSHRAIGAEKSPAVTPNPVLPAVPKIHPVGARKQTVASTQRTPSPSSDNNTLGGSQTQTKPPIHLTTASSAAKAPSAPRPQSLASIAVQAPPPESQQKVAPGAAKVPPAPGQQAVTPEATKASPASGQQTVGSMPKQATPRQSQILPSASEAASVFPTMTSNLPVRPRGDAPKTEKKRTMESYNNRWLRPRDSEVSESPATKVDILAGSPVAQCTPTPSPGNPSSGRASGGSSTPQPSRDGVSNVGTASMKRGFDNSMSSDNVATSKKRKP